MEELFITCPHYFESLLLQELKYLGIKKLRQGFCGVYAPADMDTVYTVNYCSRIATRVLYPLMRFACPNKESLYSMVKRIPWTKYLTTEMTFAIDANVNHPLLKNSLYAALVVKDAICDFFRDKTGLRPSVDIHNPDVQLNLFIQKGQATLYFDTSGAPLHKRGWRLENTEATLHESLAAGLLMQCGFRPGMSLCDPFCGSGTFLVEAAMISTQTPAGYFRKNWGFEKHPLFHVEEWNSVKAHFNAKISCLTQGQIFGADKDYEAFKTCYKHLKATSFRDSIHLENTDILSYNPSAIPNIVICNPPYGKRLELTAAVSLGLKQFIENKCDGSTKVYVLTSDASMVKKLGKEFKEEIHFKNGGMSVALYRLFLKPA
ncbi:MAG: 50S rRNA methyltransferase [Chlamydiae bacterium]|nr:50S rRNA methyltransferase [Chlamydiota bacterium]